MAESQGLRPALGWTAHSLNNSNSRRTISTFSSDIATEYLLSEYCFPCKAAVLLFAKAALSSPVRISLKGNWRVAPLPG